MKHSLLAILVIVTFAFSGKSFAQDEPQQEKKSCCGSSSKKAGLETSTDEHCSANKKITHEAETIKQETAAVKTIWNEVCPVMGNEIDKEANTVVYEGNLYGFCCNGCDKKFSKNPAKYSANLNEDGKEFIGKKEKH